MKGESKAQYDSGIDQRRFPLKTYRTDMHEDPGYVLRQLWLVKVAMINMDGEAALWTLYMGDFFE